MTARRRHWGVRAERWLDLGLDEDLATAIAVLPDLVITPRSPRPRARSSRDVVEVGEVFAGLGTRLPLEALQARLGMIEPDGRWQRWQHRGLADDLRRTLQPRRRPRAAGVAGRDRRPTRSRRSWRPAPAPTPAPRSWPARWSGCRSRTSTRSRWRCAP